MYGYIKSNDNTEGKSVTSFSITGMKSGLLTYYNPTADSDIGWKWTYPSADEKENFTTGIISFPVPDTMKKRNCLQPSFCFLPGQEVSSIFLINIRPKIVIMLLLFKLSVWKTSLCL